MVGTVPEQTLVDKGTLEAIIACAADAAAKRAVEACPLPVEWLSSKQFAAYLGVSEVTIARYVKAGVAPPSVKIARNARRFRKRDVDAWIAAGGALAIPGRKETLQ